MITRDLSVISIDVTVVSLSLFLLLTKVTHAQYRKRFRSYYNIDRGYRADKAKPQRSLTYPTQNGLNSLIWKRIFKKEALIFK